MSVGRKPKPTALRKAQGNPGHRPLNHNEPKPTGVPQCPTHLGKVAKAEWRRIAPELIALGLLTKVDRAALAAYCSAWAQWVEAETSVQKFGAVFRLKNDPDKPVKNPNVTIANAALDQMRKFLTEFGMTPASRSRIQVAPTDAADPFAEFMKGIGADEGTETPK
jgi:P27 family predicted phage terminase small subunit